MGTVASIEIAPTDAAQSLMPRLEAVFAEADARFSLYRPDSELSRVASGALTLMDASDEVRHAYGESLNWRDATGGAFTPNRPDGVTDLNGIVKAECIASAGILLENAGESGWSVNVGGDVLTSVSQQDGHPWTIGIVDPFDRTALLCSIDLVGGKRAVATSGSAERGDHVWLGGSTTPATFVQVTVVADDIITADVLATAILAGGAASLDEATERWNVDVLTIDRDGGMRATPGIRATISAPL